MKRNATLLFISVLFVTSACQQPENPDASAAPQADTAATHAHQHDHQHGHDHGDANAHMHQHDFEDLVERFESPERDAYQQPQKVLDYLGDVTGKTIMDIGAGTGYFSFKLVDAGANVIAADVDERFQEFIAHKRDSLGISAEKLQLRMLPYDSPKLTPGEVDHVIIVNTYHHIEDRPAYFAQVREGLKEDGSLIVIDFFKRELPMGPPVDMKLSESQVLTELSEAGFDDFGVNDTLLDYQYVITAK